MATQQQLPRLGEVAVRFIERAPSEEVWYYAQRCAKERWLQGPLMVDVERRQVGGLSTHEVRLEGPGAVVVKEQGHDLLRAVRDAFDRYELIVDGIDVENRGH